MLTGNEKKCFFKVHLGRCLKVVSFSLLLFGAFIGLLKMDDVTNHFVKPLVLIAAQSALPEADISNDGWQTEPLYEKLRSDDDLEAIKNSDNLKDTGSFKVKLAASEDPGSTKDHFIQFRASASATADVSLQFTLLEDGAEIFISDEVFLANGFDSYSISVSEEDVEKINDYSGLEIEVTPKVSEESKGEDVVKVSYLKMDLPEDLTSVPEMGEVGVFDVADTSATAESEVVEDGGAPITERGFLWSINSLSEPDSTTPPEDTEYEKIISEEDSDLGVGEFSRDITGLEKDTDYFIRSYAENQEGFGYSEEFSFKTYGSYPTVETLSAEVLSASSADLKGELLNNGESKILRWGFVYDTSSSRDPGNNDPENSGYENSLYEENDIKEGEFSLTAEGLQEDTDHYYRSFAENGEGISYGEEVMFSLSSEDGGSTTENDDEGFDIMNNSNGGTPDLDDIVLNNGENISLTEGSTTTISISGQVSHSDGWEYLEEETLEGVFYREGVGADCQSDPNNCYSLEDLSFSGCSDNGCDLDGRVDLWYFTEPTDQGEYGEENWLAEISVRDSSDNEAVGTSSTDVLTLLAFSVLDEEIDYGEMERGESTGDQNSTTTIRNTGNTPVGTGVSGEDMVNGGYRLDPSFQKWGTSPFSYESEGVSLSSGSQSTGLEIPKTTTLEMPEERFLYWGLGLPDDDLGTGRYTGRNYFLVTSLD
ncbi:MAG: hypothetical protein ACLFNR_00160 [Candidatus Paceibacterota bacterium]